MANALKRNRHALPVLNGILPFDPANLPRDLIAGATLAALGIPEVMGYTKIAGTPVVTGLYTILVPLAIFAIFGSSRHLVVGADSATAAVLAAGLIAMGATADSTQYVALASLSALMCGALLVGARLLRLGFIANFLSRSVLIGFLTGVGIQVAMGQLGAMFGITGVSGGTIQKFVDTLAKIPTETSTATLAVSVTVLVVIVGLELVNKKIPGALIAVVGMIGLSYALDLSSHGVAELGTVPGGLPSFGLPQDVITTANITALMPTAISMVVLILAQSAATSRAYAMRYRDSFDENVDLIGLGLSNVAAGLSGTFVVNGSPTKTEMVDSAGGRSQVAGLATAAIVLVVLLFLTAPLAYMPNAVLAAVVFLIGVRLVDYRGMADIFRLRRGEFAVALATAMTVVVVGVEEGIVLAMILSIVEHIYHSYRPFDRLVTPLPEGDYAYYELDTGKQALPGLAIYRFGSGIYYANGTRFTEEILRLVDEADPPLRWLCVAASAIGDIDYSGSETLGAVQEELASQGVTLVLADVDEKVRRELDAYGLTPKIGATHVFPTIPAMIAAFGASAPPSGGIAPGSETPPAPGGVSASARSGTRRKLSEP